MPTKNPRITITLTPAVAAVLREMSKLAGNSQSAIVGELLETSLPVFERVVQVMKAAVTIQEGAKAEIASGLERAQVKLEDQMGLMLGDMDDAVRPLLERAEKLTRRGGRAGDARSRAPAGAPARKALTPVPVTRGSGSPTGQPKGSGKVYSALNPLTGERVLLPVGMHFNRVGVITSKGIKSKGPKRGRV
jgi:hypothetical protein